MLYPCVDQTASSVCNALLHLWQYSVARANLRQMARRPALPARSFTDVCKLLRVKQMITQAYNPGGHSIVERCNAEIARIARKVFLDISDASEKNWEVNISIVQQGKCWTR